MKVLGLIFAGSPSEELYPLTKKRASAAVPVFGKYRAIDFTLSNMVNAGITKVGVLTQYSPRSLMDHLGSGKEWNLDRKRGGLFILQPYISENNQIAYYKGTADAIFQNMTLLRRSEEVFALIGSGDHIYNIDFNDVFKYHVKKSADITLLSYRIEEKDKEKFKNFWKVKTDDFGKIVEAKKDVDFSNLIIMGVIFMNKYLLMEILYSTVPSGKYDLMDDIIIPSISRLKVFSYEFKGYWRNIKLSIKEYYETNMDIFKPEVRKELFNRNRVIYTKLKDYAPSKININANIRNSIIADGSIINGTVINSIVFRNVSIRSGAIVENSIIMEDTVVEEGAVVKNAIIDKECIIREAKKIEGINEEIIVLEKSTVI